MKQKVISDELPGPLRLGQDRFESWRHDRQDRRIPETLWSLAVKLAASFGLARTAKTLRLNEQSLRVRMRGTQVGASLPARAFVELTPLSVTTPAVWVVELHQANGARMRIEALREDGVDVVSLARSFFEGQR